MKAKKLFSLLLFAIIISHHTFANKANDVDSNFACNNTIISTIPVDTKSESDSSSNNESGKGSDNTSKDDDSSNDLLKWCTLLTTLFSAITMLFSSYLNWRTKKQLALIQKQGVAMPTANILVSKRLEVYPKLHILTDKLGASIRYQKSYNKDSSFIKKEIKSFYDGMSEWDANYCIFASDALTNNIGTLRKRLEEKKAWQDSKISNDDLDWIYDRLLYIEKSLKEELAIFFTEFEINKEKTEKDKKELEYLQFTSVFFEKDDNITSCERDLIDHKRKSLGIKEERAKELEATLSKSRVSTGHLQNPVLKNQFNCLFLAIC